MFKPLIALIPLVAFVWLVHGVAECSAGPKVHVGRAWPAGQLVSMNDVDHEVFDQLLQKYVDDEGYVDYGTWHSSAEDRAALAAYLAALSRANPNVAATREAQLAYWINAYNAVTIEGILQKYPLDSIRDHTPRVFGYHIWHDLLLTVGDQQVSLDTIEHKILRPMGDPRIHFAIVCASNSCPRLLNRAYFAESLDEQLSQNTRHFFAQRSNFAYDLKRREIRLSAILNWFKADFGSNQGDRLRWIAPYLPNDQAQRLALSGKASLAYFEYDWGLNDQAKRRSR